MLHLWSPEYRKGLTSRANGNARLKHITRLCMMLVLTPMDHILITIFKMEYETHAYGIEFEIENVFKK